MVESFVLSLEDYQKQRIEAEREVQHTESRQEYYLALLKASPFVLIPLFTSAIIAFETFGDVGWLFLTAFVLVLSLAIVSAMMTRRLDKTLPDLRAKAESSRKSLQRRVALVEAEFLKYRPSTHYLYIENIPFDERMEDMVVWRSFRGQINPHLLKDMMRFDKNLIATMESMDEHAQEFVSRIKEFHEKAGSSLTEIDSELRVDQRIQPKSRMPSMIASAYYALSGVVNSLEEVTKPHGRISSFSNETRHFLQLLYGELNNSNPYPKLLENVELRKLASAAENARSAASNDETTIRLAIEALIGESQTAYKPG